MADGDKTTVYAICPYCAEEKSYSVRPLGSQQYGLQDVVQCVACLEVFVIVQTITTRKVKPEPNLRLVHSA